MGALGRIRRRLLTAAPGGDLHENLRQALRPELGVQLSNVLSREISLFCYAFFFLRLRGVVPPDATAFTIHRKSQYRALFGVLLGVGLVESAVMHTMISRSSPGLAWALTILAGYSVVWIFGDYNALRLRPILVERDQVRIRVGLRREVTIPVEVISEVVPPPGGGAPGRGTPGYLRCTILSFDEPEWLLHLSRPVQAHQPLGAPRAVTIVGVAPDDADGFRRAIAARQRDRRTASAP